jgi:hypothetical protein
MQIDAIRAAAAVMAGFPARWCIAGGWALDLFLARQTRPHADVDLAILRDDQLALRRHLAGWELRVAASGSLHDWPADEHLRLPLHEIHASRAHGDPRDLEFLLNERSDDLWIYRRHPVITLPLDRAILRANDGLPILAPEIVLLFKSKAPRAHDEADFVAALNVLGRERREWLAAALTTVDPGHRWIPALRDIPG